jgi:hypothetical protein
MNALKDLDLPEEKDNLGLIWRLSNCSGLSY